MIASSSRNRSCRSTPTRARLAMVTVPAEASSSPARTFRKVVFPEPFAPTRPYRDPAFSCSETSANRTRAPYSLARLVVAIIGVGRA